MFRSVYKRHTPFAMSLYQNTTIQGDRKITIDKVGDILLYTYLYGISDWVSAMKSIELHVGGAKIMEWDTDYLCGPYPILEESAYGKTRTNTSSLFLPVPIPPMLPVKNMRYHEIELFINWKEKPVRIQCFSMFAFVDEDLPSQQTDMLIHQVKRYTVYDGTPMKLYGPVKSLVSKILEQPSEMILDGQSVHIQDESIYSYYHSRFKKIEFTDSQRYTYETIQGIRDVRTVQRIDNFIFIFPNKIYDTTKYFGDSSSYIQLVNLPNQIWASCTNDKDRAYASTLEGVVYECFTNGVTSKINSVPHEVYSMYHYNGLLILVGNAYITYIRLSANAKTTMYLNGKTYDGSFQVKDHPDFGDAILLFRNDGSNGILVFSEKTFQMQEYAFLTVSDVYDRFSSTLFLNGYTYVSSGFGDTFTQLHQGILEEFLLEPKGKYYTSLVYDGSKFVYIYGQDTIVRFDASAYQYSMFIPFCLDVQSYESTGYLNFDSIQNVIFKGCGTGTMYAVQYNFLRIQNGMAGLLYS